MVIRHHATYFCFRGWRVNSSMIKSFIYPNLSFGVSLFRCTYACFNMEYWLAMCIPVIPSVCLSHRFGTKYGPHCTVLHTCSSLTHTEPGYDAAGTANSCSKHTHTDQIQDNNIIAVFLYPRDKTKRQVKKREKVKLGIIIKKGSTVLMCDPDCAIQPCLLSVYHYCHPASVPVCQAPMGTFGIRWQIHNTSQQHDLVLEGPTQAQWWGQLGPVGWVGEEEEWDTRWIC